MFVLALQGQQECQKILENYPSVLQLEYQIHESVGWYVHMVYTNTHTRSRNEKQALVSNRTEKKSRGIKLDVHVLHRIS